MLNGKDQHVVCVLCVRLHLAQRAHGHTPINSLLCYRDGERKKEKSSSMRPRIDDEVLDLSRLPCVMWPPLVSYDVTMGRWGYHVTRKRAMVNYANGRGPLNFYLRVMLTTNSSFSPFSCQGMDTHSKGGSVTPWEPENYGRQVCMYQQVNNHPCMC